ncbi:anoctamin-9-like isoform X1 [Acipenser ruthenus]|uniref:anoctamin-9-like isoform X1 n=1 Tax=Acipenser ruthenus TaxID=7906 RepID=UPI00145A5D9C|nr:anoctamin-9-like isoform X1 [Acipenser ruthenus]
MESGNKNPDMDNQRSQDNIELLPIRDPDHTTETDCTPLIPCSKYDYVLVGKEWPDDSEHDRKQKAFIKTLENKGYQTQKLREKNKVYFGILAPQEIFSKYAYLLKNPDNCCEEKMVSTPTRIRIVKFMLDNTFIGNGEKLHALLKEKVFEAVFPLHEETEQKKLINKWARWTACFKQQPINEVRMYFGEKVALYFLWLGWYTYMLVPAAVIGVIVFLYGLAFFESNPLIKEVCEGNSTIMCPLCDKCLMWQLSETCTYAKVTHLFDNEGTVFFSMFMALWATWFLEIWKRHRSQEVCKWKLNNWDENEEELALDLINDSDCTPDRYQHSYLRSILVMVLVCCMIALIIGLAQALVVFRVIATVFLSDSKWQLLSDHANTVAVMMGAVLHYLTITIMNKVNRKVALFLCDLENVRSNIGKERNFTVKMFTFQFLTLFSSLIYVAFFLGRINGRPGSYVRIAGMWRLEECHPSGCITDLFIQMAVIMVLKQTLSNVVEFLSPWVSYKIHNLQDKSPKGGSESNCIRDSWLRNYHMNEVDAFSLFNEFLEMMIQYSFTTIFVAAFPLAPLLALINNFFEIRLDAIKMVSLERRMFCKKTNDIGIWLQVLQAIGVLAVIANGLVIGVTSDFIPRLVYKYIYGPCAKGATDIDCMSGYINNSLSTVYMKDHNIRRDFEPGQLIFNGNNVTQCKYKDYRSDDDYAYTSQFWLIFAARFAFVLLFEHVAVVIKFIAAWFVPDVPLAVKNENLDRKFERLKRELRKMENRTTDI